MVQELLSGAVVGHVAAPLSRDQDLLSGLFLMFQHRNGVALPHGRTGRHQARRACSDHQHICHPAIPPTKPDISIVSYQNRPPKAMCPAAEIAGKAGGISSAPRKKALRRAFSRRSAVFCFTASPWPGRGIFRPVSLPGGCGCPRRTRSSHCPRCQGPARPSRYPRLSLSGRPHR